MALAALLVSLASVGVSVVFAVRGERWRRREFERAEATRVEEDADRKEQLALQRHALEYDEGGWRRWGTGPPKRDES
jgi:hypothetical protein